MFNFGLQVRRF